MAQSYFFFYFKKKKKNQLLSLQYIKYFQNLHQISRQILDIQNLLALLSDLKGSYFINLKREYFGYFITLVKVQL